MRIPITQYNKTVALAEQVRADVVHHVEKLKALTPERKAKLDQHYKELLTVADFQIEHSHLAKLRRAQGELKVNYLRAVALLRETAHLVR